jgi:endonuclease/exonuclease/phosphatase family metal-dependent hydrolase
MKIISWNCNGALRKKFEHVAKLDADIYIIQECEDPVRANHKEYEDWSNNHLWIGDTKNKGIGIFAKSDITLQHLDWSNSFRDHSVKHFLPCLVNNDFQLLAVWTHKNNSPNFGYMGQFWKYLKTNVELFDKIIIAGDFNSNAIWDEWDRWWNHSDVVATLNEKGIKSVYHQKTNESQGNESKPTFYLQRKKEKAYHIDYVFTSHHFTSDKIHIGNYEDWIEISDHVPITYEN